MTATRVSAFIVDGTTLDFNIEERASATPGTAGTDLLGGELRAVPTTGVSTSGFSNPGLAADNWLWVDLSVISGSVTQVQISLDTTVD